MDEKKENDCLSEEGEVRSDDEEEIDIYKTFESDENVDDLPCSELEEEWSLSLSSVGSENNEIPIKSKPVEGEKYSERTQETNENTIRKLPSLLSTHTDPPDYYYSRRQNRYDPWRSSRREYDRRPYDRRYGRYDGRYYERERKERRTESRYYK